MARGVCPRFFEEGYFSSPNVKERRLIQNKKIYILDRLLVNGEKYPDTLFTRDDGKLKTQKSLDLGREYVDVIVPLWQGTYYFFVSSHDLRPVLKDRRDDRLLLLNQDNCTRVQVTDEMNQEIVLPYPMCYHSSDGAIAVAEYILEEIRTNSVCTETLIIRSYNIPMHGSKTQAYSLWAGLVWTGGVWDHKPLISGSEFLRENAVWRPREKNASSFSRGFHHKYKDHDYYYDVWSNIHYGYVGRAAGFTKDELLDGSGLAQRFSDFPRKTVHDKTVSGFRRYDPIPDQQTIKLGIELFDLTNGNAESLTALMILDGLEELGNAELLEDSRVKHICFDDDGFTRA